MTPELWIAFAAVFIPAIVTVAVSLANRHKLSRLEVSINGRLAQLLKANAEAAHAAGIVSASLDSTAIADVINRAMTEALAMSPPSSMAPVLDTALATDTNSRVRNIQDDAAAVAAALIVKNAAAIAAALVVKTAEDAASLAKQEHAED